MRTLSFCVTPLHGSAFGSTHTCWVNSVQSEIALGSLFFVEATCLREYDGTQASHMLEAVSQAIALVELTRYV